MDKRFKNSYLANNIKSLTSREPRINPEAGDIGGSSIEFTNEGDTVSYESILYRDVETRDADLKLLLTLLK